MQEMMLKISPCLPSTTQLVLFSPASVGLVNSGETENLETEPHSMGSSFANEIPSSCNNIKTHLNSSCTLQFSTSKNAFHKINF